MNDALAVIDDEKPLTFPQLMIVAAILGAGLVGAAAVLYLLWILLPIDMFLKLIPIAIVVGGLLNIVPLLVYLERKICALIQDRIGPNRVGLMGPNGLLGVFGIHTKTRILGGLIQPLADAIKLFTKESFMPAGADKLLFTLAPVFALMPPFLAFIVIPVGSDIVLNAGTPEQHRIMLQVADLHVGILFVLAVASLSAYGLAFGGWASNNKYALLGGVRAMAQMISYEIGMSIVILAMVMEYNSVSLRTMVGHQTQGTLLGAFHCDANWIWGWGVFHQPLAFILFTICAFAENNRLPFDLPECEAELVGGFHTEYNSMGFGMFFQGEYIAMLSMGALIATLFFGGWHYPGYQAVHDSNQYLAAFLALVSFGVKVMIFVMFSIWVRWTLPRFRWDQLMNIGWKGIVPLALGNLLLTAFLHLPNASLHKEPPQIPASISVEK